jgi:hypothetical protein
MCDTSLIFMHLPKVNRHPLVEFSTNLVTLLRWQNNAAASRFDLPRSASRMTRLGDFSPIGRFLALF